METKKVKNIADTDLSLVDIGLCKRGEIIEVPKDFHNSNFVEVREDEEKVEPKDEVKVKTKTK